MASLDRNANNGARLRRNAQRTRHGDGTSDIKVTAPVTNTSGSLGLGLLSTGGLQVTTSLLAMKLADTSVQTAAGGLSVRIADTSLTVATGLKVNLATNPGLTVATGLKLLLSDTSLVLGAGGVGVNLAANSGLAISSGLKVLPDPAGALTLSATGLAAAVDGTTMQISADKLAVKTVGAGQLGIVTTKGDLLGFDTTPNRIPIGADGRVLTADSTLALGLKWAAPTVFTSPLTTKGDLYTFSTVDARLPIGTDTFILTADSTQTTGMKWAASTGATFANPTASVGVAAVNGVATTAMRSDAAPALDQTIAPTMTNTWVFSKDGAASVSAIKIIGNLFQAGSTTTTKPLVLIETAGVASAGWNTAGTFFGINMPSGLGTPFFCDFQLAGVSKCMIRSDGQITGSGLICSGVITCTVLEAPANNTLMSVQARTFTNSSGTNVAIDLVPTYNQTLTAGSVDLRINRTETVIGSGAHLFIDCQISTASKFKVSRTGEVTAVHRLGGGTAPAIAAGTGAGTTPTIGIAGTDTAGTVTLTTGTGTPAASATIFTVTFATAYATAPYVVFAPANGNAAALTGATSVFVTATTTTFVFTSGATGLTVSKQYIWNYHTIG